MPQLAPVITPVAYTTADAARLLSVSPRHVANLIARGELRSVLIGGCRRVPHAEIERLTT